MRYVWIIHLVTLLITMTMMISELNESIGFLRSSDCRECTLILSKTNARYSD
jgi:hypothetical protein